MRILIVTQYFYPEQFRINDICKELVKRGNQVTVLTGLPNYPDGNIYSGYEKSYLNIDDYYGATVYRCKLRPRLKGAKNLALNYLSFVIQANRKAKEIRQDFDIIYVYGLSPITIALPAIKIGKKCKAPIAYYCLDIWPESVRDANNGRMLMSKKNPIFLCAKLISIYIYRHMDWIGTKCKEFVDYITKECHVPEKKLSVIPEHAEDVYLRAAEKPIDNGTFDIVFLGNLGKTQNCNQMIQSLSEIKEKNDIVLHFVGDGSEKENLIKQAQLLGIEHQVQFHGHYPIHETIKFYDMADVCILALSSETTTGMTPPGKLYGYMAAGRGVIAAIDGAGKRLIECSKCGICVKPDNVSDLKDAIIWAANNKDAMVEKGMQGRAYFINNLTLKKHVDELEKQFKIMLYENKNAEF